MTRRERMEVLVSMLSEPARGKIRRVLDGQREGRIDAGRDLVRNFTRSRVIRDELAVHIAFEAVELLSAGALRISWLEKLAELAFGVETFPSGRSCGCVLEVVRDEHGWRAVLHVSWGVFKGEPDLTAAVRLVAREIAMHLGVAVQTKAGSG